MRISKLSGFSFTEAMISVAILGLIATVAGYSLRTSQQRDELRNAGRILAADLKSLQSRALTAQNIKFCTVAGVKTVCEDSAAACSDTCTAIAPAGVGLYLAKNATTYQLFAKYDPNTTDWRKSSDGEVFLNRDLVKSGGPNVKVTNISSATVPSFDPINIAFQRQNGSMRIDSCPSGCTNQTNLTITLTHNVSGKTVNVTLNQITGRISLEE